MIFIPCTCITLPSNYLPSTQFDRNRVTNCHAAANPYHNSVTLYYLHEMAAVLVYRPVVPATLIPFSQICLQTKYITSHIRLLWSYEIFLKITLVGALKKQCMDTRW